MFVSRSAAARAADISDPDAPAFVADLKISDVKDGQRDV